MISSFQISWADFKSAVNAGSTFRELENNKFYTLVISDNGVVFYCIVDKLDGSVEQAEYEEDFRSLKKQIQDESQVVISEQAPFSAPTFRTKRDATPGLITLQENATESVDYTLTEERYVHGGEIVYTGIKIGDWISASIVDDNGVIPAPYRAILCEAWPIVATYIYKHYVPEGSGYQSIQTYPLNAKITEGLKLRVTVNTCSTIGERKIGMNYYLTKKL